MAKEDYQRFANLTFEDFRKLAKDKALSRNQRIGFPDAYRADKEMPILLDWIAKLPNLASTDQIVFDIGSGCGDLAELLVRYCDDKNHRLLLIDSQEMLDALPDTLSARKVAAFFPECPELLAEYRGRVNTVLVYSVFQYAYAQGCADDFLDGALSLLAPSGRLLIGDIPNVSMRRRFFSSDAGKRFHRAFMQTDTDPDVSDEPTQPGQIDDDVVLAILARVRAAGFHAFVVPQADDLPMANRREDILIERP